MNFTVDNSTDLLFKREILPVVIPVVVFIALLTFLGIIGNAIVIYVFSFSFKRSTVHFFITLLASFDIVCCIFGLPMEIVEFYYVFRYPSNAGCKFQRLVNFTCNTGSVAMLLAISIERYRKVCRAALTELSQIYRKVFVFVVVILSLVLAVPIVVFSKKRPLQHPLFPNITMYICTLPSFMTNRFAHYYLIVMFLFISVALIAMLVSYYHVWRTAKIHLMMAHNRRQASCACAEDSLAKKRLGRTTRTVIATTVLFALSFFPSFILIIIVLKIPAFFTNFSEEMAYFTFVHLYVLNCSFNPFVYGYFNEQFRFETKKLIAKMLKMKEPKMLDFSSENTP